MKEILKENIKASETLLAALISTPWWLLLLKAMAAIVFGIYVIFYPGITIIVLTLMFGVYLFIDGLIIGYRFLIKKKRELKPGFVIFRSAISILAGLAIFLLPEFLALINITILSYLVGISGIVGGVLEISTAVRIYKGEKSDWGGIVSGILSIIFGTVLCIFPFWGGIGLVIIVGIISLVIGVMLLYYSFKFKTLSKNIEASQERADTVE